MSLKIEVTSKVTTKTVTKKSTGEVFNIPEQECWAHIPGQQYPQRVVRSVGKGAQPLAAGVYVLAPSSFYVDRFGNLGIKGQFEVLPIAASAPTAKAA